MLKVKSRLVADGRFLDLFGESTIFKTNLLSADTPTVWKKVAFL